MTDRCCILYPRGNTKAVTMSFDDGVVQDAKMTQLLKNYGVRATFNLNGGMWGSHGEVPCGNSTVAHDRLEEIEICATYAGHEIAAHGLTHQALGLLPGNLQMSEIINDKDRLEALTHLRIAGFAYPYGSYNPTTLKLLKLAGIKYGRTTESSYSFEPPEDFCQWHPTCHFCDSQREALARKFLKKKVQWYEPLQMFYLWGHCYELTDPEAWDHFESFLELIAGHEDIWYATNIELAEYILAAQRLEFFDGGKQVFNPSGLELWMRCGNQVQRIQPGGCLKVHALK